MKNAIISGTGSYLPGRQLTNTELESSLDTTHEWVYSRTGISSRCIASDEETTSFMAGKAALKALESINWTGNIRELRNVIERLIILCDEVITAADVKRFTSIS